MWSMAVRTRSTLSRVEGAEPRPVVLQGALAGRRVVGDHLGHQLRVVADLADDPVGEHLSGELVHLAHRPLLVRVVGVDTGGLQALVASGPEDQEPVPAAVEGEVAQRPPHAGADTWRGSSGWGTSTGPCAGRPSGGDVGGDGGGDLEAAGPGADHGHPLSRSGRRRGPSGPSGTPDRRSAPAPSISGTWGRLSWPTAEITARAVQDVLGAVGATDAHRPGGRCPRPRWRPAPRSPTARGDRCRACP